MCPDAPDQAGDDAATTAGRGPDPARVVLYVRAGCHLCDAARDVVADAAGRAGAGWAEVDVDTDPALVERYGELVPVVTVDGVQQGYWRIDGSRLDRALARP